MVVLDRSRKSLWCDLAVARRMEFIAQCPLGRIVRIQHIVVGEQMPAIRIRMSVCLPCDLIGKLRCFLDVLGTGSSVIGEMPLSIRQRKCNMPLIARANARVPRGRRIRREIDTRVRCILVIPIIDLLCCYRSMRCLVIDVEAVACNLTANDIAIKVEFFTFDLGFWSIERCIVEVVVHAVRIRRSIQSNVRILELVTAGVDLCFA